MNRFFSKLDLRDIRIDPQASQFPPDAEHVETSDATPEETADEGAVTAAGPDDPISGRQRTSYTPAWSVESATDPDVVAVDRSEASEASVGSAPRSDDGDDVLRVSARSRPSAVAGAIAGVVREAGRAEVQAIGAGATNQAVKAVAIARDYLHETGIEVICLPGFIDVTIENEDRTAIRLVIEPR